MYRILVIEDEKDIQDILKNYLTDQGYLVTLADDGVDGIARFHGGTYDLILLDVMMPKIDGFGVCELIRRESEIPIIMLTALEKEEYQIKGLDLKADDYITKPFSMPVLLRKIAAILRRTHREEEHQVIRYKSLSVDVAGRHVYVCSEDQKQASSGDRQTKAAAEGGQTGAAAESGQPKDAAESGQTGCGRGSAESGQTGYGRGLTESGQTGYGRGLTESGQTGCEKGPAEGAAGRMCTESGNGRTEIDLTQKEFELLHVLLINKGIVLTRQKLLNMVWGQDYFGEERIVDTHIKNIRKKMGQDFISTIRGVGYRIDKEN